MPFGDAEMLPEGFNVGDQMPSRVVDRAGIWSRFSASTLVKQDYTVVLGIEKRCVAFRDVAAGSTV